MRNFIIIIALTITVGSFNKVCGENQNSEDWSSLVISYIKLDHSIDVEENAGLKQIISQLDYPEDAVQSAIKLWKRNERDFLELIWWRQSNRIVRTTILALFFTQSKMSTSNAPTFDLYIPKFSDVEKTQRQEELEFVLKNKERLNELIKKALNR